MDVPNVEEDPNRIKEEPNRIGEEPNRIREEPNRIREEPNRIKEEPNRINPLVHLPPSPPRPSTREDLRRLQQQVPDIT